MHITSHSDITILGAGPAGLTAAIQLGKAGIPCLLIDGSGSGRGKICGDGLSGKALSILNKIDPQYLRELSERPFVSPSYAIRFYSPNHRMVQIAFPSGSTDVPPGLVCQRKDFDRFLLEKAIELPAVTYKGQTVITSVNRTGGEWELSHNTGVQVTRTRLLMLATGSDRRVIRSVVTDYQGMEKEGIGLRAYFNNVSGSDEANAIEIHFLKELLPWYLWIFPFHDGSANVGIGMLMDHVRQNPSSLKELLFKMISRYPYLTRRFENASMVGKAEAHRLPFFTGRQKLAGDNYLLLGDAACLIDPFTGEGISHAMISGYLAAECAAHCLETGDFNSEVTRTYQEAVYRKLGEELALGLRLQQLARRRLLLNLVIGKASRNKNVQHLLEDMLTNSNTKSTLSRPMFYLKLMLGL